MRDKEDFSSLEVGQPVIIEECGYVSGTQLYLATVVKRTKTRLTTKVGERESVWNLDGTPYPRRTGYLGSAYLRHPTLEYSAKMERSSTIRSIKNKLYAVSQSQRGSDSWDCVSTENLKTFSEALSEFTKQLKAGEKDGKG